MCVDHDEVVLATRALPRGQAGRDTPGCRPVRGSGPTRSRPRGSLWDRDVPVQTLGDYSFLPYGEDYRTYAVAQIRELVQRYRPDILWNDISWPTGQQRLNTVLADYYNTVPDGVIDDRWSTSSFGKQVMGLGPLRWAFDQAMKPPLHTPGATDSVNTPGAGSRTATSGRLSTRGSTRSRPGSGKRTVASAGPLATTGRRPMPTTPLLTPGRDPTSM